MDLKGLVLCVLLVGFVFVTVGFIVDDLKTEYPEVNVNTSSWEGRWDYMEDINTSVVVVQEKIMKMGDPEVGWFTRLAEGAISIPWAIITMMTQTLFLAIANGAVIVSEVGLTVGVPTVILAFGTVALIIVVVFKLIEFWRRYKT